MKIYPIGGTNVYSRKTSFKGYYDPTCQSIPASMRNKASELVEKTQQSFQEVGHSAPVKEAIEGFKSKLGILSKEESSEISQSVLSNVDSSSHGSVIHHFLPDGVTSIDIPTDLPAAGAKILDANNLLIPDNNDIVTHSSVLENFMEQASDVPDIDSINTALDAGSAISDAGGSILDGIADHIDDLKDVISNLF